jgi:hypothetical protein
MKAPLLAVVAIAAAALLLVPSLGLGGDDSRNVLNARTLAAVTEPYTGAANAIRGVPGGGLPWIIGDAKADLRSNGDVEIEVEGLVLAKRAPVPPALQGVNPVAQFKVIVSCQTTVDGAAAVSNVSSPTFAADRAGNAEAETSVDLPTPCFAPIVFVATPGGNWLAVTGR